MRNFNGIDRATSLTDIPGRPEGFWGQHSTYVGSFQPPRWLVRLVGHARAYDLMGLKSAFRLLCRRRHHPRIVTDGGASGLIFACLQSAIPWGRKPHAMVDCLWYQSSNPIQSSVKRAARRLASRSVTKFVVWASHEVDDYARAFGIPREKLVYIPHYSSLDQYAFTIRDDGYLFAGGNGDRDYLTLIEAIRGHEIPTWIATTNHSLIGGLSLPGHVKVEGTTHEGFRQAMAAARLIVVPMQAGLLHSGGQQTCLNAMMMGKPTIAVGRKWAVDLIEHEVDGLIVDYQDVSALRSSIEWVLENPEQACRMGLRAKSKAERFTSRRAMEAVHALLVAS